MISPRRWPTRFLLVIDHPTPSLHPPGMTLPGHHRIAIDLTVCGRPPRSGGHADARGGRVRALAAGASAAEIAGDFAYVGEEDVRAVLAYAAAMANHPVTRR